MPKRKKDDFEDFNEFEDFSDDDFDNLEINSVRFLGKKGDGEEEEIFNAEESDTDYLPDMLKFLLMQGAMDAMDDVKSTIRAELELETEGEDREIEVNAVFETDDHARYPGLSRILLAVQQGNVTFGSFLCQSLVKELKERYEDLLFGLIDNIYLHATRSYTLCSGHVCASTRFFWSEDESPHPLIISNAADIVENEELIYLLVGDLVEDLVNRLENPPAKSKKGGRRLKSPKKI